MAEPIMDGVLTFLESIGLFSVILPFLLIYVIVFALLEKTMILGVDQIDKDTKIPKKNLNAIFAFSTAFFAILSQQVVSAMNEAIGPIMLVLLIIVLFMMLRGAYKKDDGIEDLTKTQKTIAFWTILITIIMIVLNSIKTDSGQTWLDYIWDYLTSSTNVAFVGAIALLIGFGIFMYWITKDPKKEESD